MVKKEPHKKESLLIVINLCKVNYQILLITYLKITKKNAKHIWKEKNQIRMRFYWVSK